MSDADRGALRHPWQRARNPAERPLPLAGRLSRGVETPAARAQAAFARHYLRRRARSARTQAAIDLLEKRTRAVRSGQDEPRTSITHDFRFVQRASDAQPGGNR